MKVFLEKIDDLMFDQNCIQSGNLINIEDVFESKGRTKILHLLCIEKEASISHIVQVTCLNHLNVKRHLGRLVELNFLREKLFGRVKIYELRMDLKPVQALLNLISFWENRSLPVEPPAKRDSPRSGALAKPLQAHQLY